MFGIGGWELALILVFGFIIVGPERLPQMGRTIGRALRQFQRAQDQANDFLKKEVYDPFKDVEALSDPFKGFDLDMSIKGIRVDDGKPTPAGFSEKPKEEVAAAPTRFSDGKAGVKPVTASGNGTQTEEQETFSQRKERLAREKMAANAAKERNATDENAAGSAHASSRAANSAAVANSLYGIPDSYAKRREAAAAAKAKVEAEAAAENIDLEAYAAEKARKAEEARKAAEKAQRSARKKKVSSKSSSEKKEKKSEKKDTSEGKGEEKEA